MRREASLGETETTVDELLVAFGGKGDLELDLANEVVYVAVHLIESELVGFLVGGSSQVVVRLIGSETVGACSM